MLYWRLRTSTDQACISLTLALHGHSLSTIIHLVQDCQHCKTLRETSELRTLPLLS